MRTVFKFDREEDAAVENRTTYRTRAQDELLAYLSAEPGKHFTAAEIRDHFAKQEKPIGTATIYRQLERFVAEGKIRKYILGPGESACYSYAGDQQCWSHFHCKCESCGKLIHMDCEPLRQVKAYLEDERGFDLDMGKTVLYGTCEACRRK